MTRHKDFQHSFADLSPSFNPWLASAGPMFEAATQLTANMCEGVAEMGKEWAAFTAGRMQEDFTLPARLSKCRSPQDVQQVYLDFWATAFAQYQNEFSRMAQLSQAMGRAAVAKAGQAVEAVGANKIAA